MTNLQLSNNSLLSHEIMRRIQDKIFRLQEIKISQWVDAIRNSFKL